MFLLTLLTFKILVYIIQFFLCNWNCIFMQNGYGISDWTVLRVNALYIPGEKKMTSINFDFCHGKSKIAARVSAKI